MVSIALLLSAGSVLLYSVKDVSHRLCALGLVQRTRKFQRGFRRGNVVLVALSGFIGWLVLGLGGAISGTVLCAVACRKYVLARQSRKRLHLTAGMVEALGALVAELETGVHPAFAAESAAADADPVIAQAMLLIATTARLGGDVQQGLLDFRAGQPVLASVLSQLARTWHIAELHGIPLAGVFSAVREDLAQRLRFAGQVQAKMAGPRMSALVLAALPGLGILLGEAINAGPLHILSTTPSGQVLLVAGTGLICAGLLWSTKLTEQVIAQ